MVVASHPGPNKEILSHNNDECNDTNQSSDIFIV